MSTPVLDQVSLGYQLYWNAEREPAAVGLAIGTHGAPLSDGPARHAPGVELIQAEVHQPAAGHIGVQMSAG